MNKNQVSYRPPLYQVLSIDVVLGTLAVGFFSVKLLDVKPEPVWWVVLPLAVWSVYTLDHLLDGFKRKGQSTIFRHSFHYNNRRLLFTMVILAGAASLTLSLLYFSWTIILGGILLGAMIMVYFALLYFLPTGSPLLQKELIIALIYMAGILLAPLVWHGGLPSSALTLLFVVMALLAWAEGSLVSWFDFERDRKDGHDSFTGYVGKGNSRKIMIIVLSLLGIFSVVSFFFTSSSLPKAAFAIECLMSVILLSMALTPAFFARNYRFRWVGEAVFLLPALLVLF